MLVQEVRGTKCEALNDAPQQDEYKASLVKENTSLKKESAELAEQVNNYKFIVMDMKAKIEDLENEKNSLITVIRILQEDQKQDESNAWNIAGRPKKIPVGLQNNSCRTDDTRVNRYSILSEIDEDKEVNELTQARIPNDKDKDIPSDVNNSQAERLDNRFSGLNVDEHIEDVELVNATGHVTQLPAVTEGKEPRKELPTQDQIEALSKTKSKVTNSDNAKRPNQIGRPSKVAIVGDSMIKYVNPSKLRKSIKQNVHVKTFPGAKVADMHHYVKPTLKQAPEYLVLHVGTNDLKQSSPRQISTSIANLGQEIQNIAPTTKLIISEVITRNDDPQISAKVKEVNTKLLQVCKNNKWEHISHKNIVEKHLNPYGVHLNRHGTIALAKNFTDFLKATY
jgi:hypothetical protein